MSCITYLSASAIQSFIEKFLSFYYFIFFGENGKVLRRKARSRCTFLWQVGLVTVENYKNYLNHKNHINYLPYHYHRVYF